LIRRASRPTDRRAFRGIPAALVWAALSVAPSASSAEEAAPLVAVEAVDVDLGQVVRGETRLAEFVLHNRGDATLRITEVKPGCGCTVADYDERIEPGGKGRIRATVDTSTLSGFVGRGLTATTNDPVTPELYLTFHAHVVGSVILFPDETLQLESTAPGKSTAEVLIKRDPTESGGELRISDVRSSVPWLEARMERLTERRELAGLPPGSPGDYVLTLALGSDGDPGAVEQGVTFRTDLPRQPEVTIPVHARFRPAVNLSTRDVTLAPGTTTTVLASVRKGLDPDALEVEAEPETLAVNLVRAGSRHYKLELTFAGSAPAEGSVWLQVGDERQRLPVRVRAAE
jgi:hypothetical protein